MDSLSNGELLEASHKDKPKDPENHSESPVVVKKFKNKSMYDSVDSAKTDDKCTEVKSPDVVKKFKNKSMYDSIDSAKTDDKCTEVDEISIKISPEAKTDSNVDSVSTVEQLNDEVSATKENGISDADKHEKEDNPSVPQTDEELNPEPDNTSSDQSETIESEGSKEETVDKDNDQDTSKSPAVNVNSVSEANKDAELPTSPEIEGANDCKDDELESPEKTVCPNDPENHSESPAAVKVFKNKSMYDSPMVVSEKKPNDDEKLEEKSPICAVEEEEAMDCSADPAVPEADAPSSDSSKIDAEVAYGKHKLDSTPVAENSLKTEESVEISEISQEDKEKLDSNVDSDVVIESSNENSGEDEPMDCDERSESFVEQQKSEQITESQVVELSSSSSESDKSHENESDKILNEQENLKNDMKHEEHPASDIDNQQNTVPKDNEKNVPSSNETSAPKLSNGEKENKNTDSATLQERLSKTTAESFVLAELTNEETGFPDAFTGLVKIGKYISVKGDFTLRSSEALVESPSLTAPYLLKEPDSFPSKDKDAKSPEIKDFFHSAAGEILIGIGLSRVNEWFHKDMVRIKKRQLKRKKTPELEGDLAMHEKFAAEAQKANNVYSFDFRLCETCGFTTESSIVMEGHLLIPHLTQRREYQCNFCEVIKKDAKEMIEHMKQVHGKVGRIQPPSLFFECIYCAFESNSKVKLNHHLVKCQRVYDQGVNQAPGKDFDFPALTPKPITVAVVKAYEKSLGSMQKGRGRPKKDFASELQHMNQFTPSPGHMPPYRGSSNSPLADSLMHNQMLSGMLRTAHAAGQFRPGMHMTPPNQFMRQMMPMMGNNHLPNFSPNIDPSKKQSNIYKSIFENKNPGSKIPPSLTITPLPKLTGPYPVPMAKPSSSVQGGVTQPNSGNLVVCEICDGYIKDLEQLRTHMQLIHKVKIHPKMLVSRPPLNCQKCQWRFFTDQGLERHLLGAHGLVTSNMQEMANKGKDAGCCTICGRVYASKLVSHMNQIHKISLKPAHLSYKCTVCSATFNLYRLFENHVYLVHSGAGKRSADGRSSPSSKKLKTTEDGEKEKKTASEEVGDENVKKCSECGGKVSKDNEEDKCGKCLGAEGLIGDGAVSAKTIKDELIVEDKVIEEAAA